jgi:broad specificity phosphatase PhoE
VSTATVVHLLRHGEVANPTGVLYGRLPGFQLSELGQEMAVMAAKSVIGRDITHLGSSPLERALQTAQPFAAEFGLPIGVDDRLIESANFFEGKRVGVGDGALRDPRNWPKLWNPFKPSWAEPYAEIAARMWAALQAAREQATGHEALLVSHQSPIWILRRFAEHRHLWHDPRTRQCGLASLTSFRFDGETLAGIDYAEPAADLVARSKGARGAKGA